MKTFREFINEVIDVGDAGGKSDKLGMGKFLGKKPPANSKKIGEIDGHPVHHVFNDREDEENYTVHHKKTGRSTNVLSTTKGKGSEAIVMSASNGNGVKQHDLYHHLITKHNKVLTADEQTTGGHHIWKKLAQMKGIGIHGWNPIDNEPVNIDRRLKDEDETHVPHSAFKGGRDPETAHIKDMQLVAHRTILRKQKT